MSVRSKVASFISDHLLAGFEDVPADEIAKVVVAVSGGPDSLALLHLLARGDFYPAKRLIVAHFNHGLRPAAAHDEAFVAKTAVAWGLEYRSAGTDVATDARRQRKSVEEMARLARYRFLAEIARREGAMVAVTGHNADDQAETVLMHFLRGSGMAGLRGMLPVGPLPGAPEVTLLRPLLSVRAGELREYCRENGLTPVEDHSNDDMTIHRNRLRHELLPLLTKYNPKIVERLNNTAAVLAADYDLLRTMQEDAWSSIVLTVKDGWLQLDFAGWRRLPLALRRSTLRRACETLNPSLRDIGFQSVEQARLVSESGQVGGRSGLPGDLRLAVGYDRLMISLPGVKIPLPDFPQTQPGSRLALAIPGRLELGNGWTIETALEEDATLAEAVADRGSWEVCVDPDELSEVTIRTRQPGERFRPLGMKGKSALLSDVMINLKIPASLRAGWPIVAGRDHLFWLVGHHIDERAKVTAESKRILRLTVKRRS